MPEAGTAHSTSQIGALAGREPMQYPWRLQVIVRNDLEHCPRWQFAFANERKDHRYYELVEDTLHPEFEYGYFVIRDAVDQAYAVQPFFLMDLDLLAGASPRFGVLIDAVRRMWPGLMRARALMVGCVAGEGHLDGDEACHRGRMELLASTIAVHARRLGARLIVFKEFPARYRSILDCLIAHGFTRIPSLPMTRLCIDYANFDDYMNQALNSATRKKLRKKFEATAQAFPPIEMSVINDATPVISQIYPLYLQVYQRSKLHFEKLTEQYFCDLGRRMGDKVRFFLWRQNERIVAFAACMVHGDAIYAEYIGLDYDVALDLHLYHYVFRDMVSWAIANGYQWFRSGGLNYDPKLHLRHLLDPIDLYVRHTSTPINAALKRILPVLEPTRYDETLAKFRNYQELWAQPETGPGSIEDTA
ncbi:GNAT family N-acetyltransferase [Bradyrhizobium sp. INPA03-11B]|uniref:GNAT family N-acetyltransferase n=1 Tax=Bradyrhizobium sp. INPA03-11B TaxID=418598 RepID=UPI00338F1337